MRNPTRFASFGALACALVLAGCGGSHVASPTASMAQTEATSTAASPTQTTETASPRMIGSFSNAVRNECWYALNRDFLSQPNSVNGPSNDQSNWAYIGPDADAGSSAIKYVLNTYGYAVSDRWPQTGFIPQSKFNQCVADLIDPSYDMHFEGTNCGHGCQCVSFVTMILYRAVNYRLAWAYRSLDPGKYDSWTKAQVGDIIFRKDSDSSGHLAIVVALPTSKGVTVVDSNFVGHEQVWRHTMHASKLSAYHTYSGSGKWR